MPPNPDMALADATVKPRISIPAKQIEKGVARDMGWERLIPANGFPLMLGMDDVLAVEREVPRLMRAKHLKLEESDFLSGAPPQGQKLAPSVEWYWRVANLLPVAFPMVRLSEPVQAVYELAREEGYLDENGNLLSDADIWRQRTPDGTQQALAFLEVLKAGYASRPYRDALRHREQQAEHNRERHLLLLDYLLVKHGCFRAIALDFYLDQGGGFGAAHPGYSLELVVQCRGHLFNNMRFMPVFREGGYGYLWHLSFHRLRGYYIRVFFFVAPGGLGENEKFLARASRAWWDVTGGLGACADCRKHPNELARVGGMVDANNEKSVKKMEKALVYQVEKDKRLRVMTQDKLHVFGHTEMAGLDKALLDRAWLRLFTASSKMTAELIAAQEARLQRLHLELAKKATLKADGLNLGGFSVGANNHAV